MYWQIKSQNDLSSLQDEWQKSLELGGLLFLIFAIILMPFNWLIEISKWKLLVNNIQPFSLKQSAIGVLIGIAVGVVTPARVGEYAGRLAGVEAENRSQALMLNFINSISQNLINFIIGILGGFYFLVFKFQIDITIATSFFILAVLIALLALFFYFNIQKIINVTLKLPFSSYIMKWIDKLLSIKEIPISVLRKVLNLSFWRYMIYMIQYVLVLKFFGLDIEYYKIMAGVSLIYLVQTGIPLPPLSSLLARGQIAILVWSGFSLSMTAILAATFILWVINLIIPALFGLILIVLNRYESKTYA
jgi:hypothetical protein